MNRTRDLLPGLLAAGLLAGCVSASVEQLKTRPVTRVASGDSVVVLGRHHRAEYETESDFIDCVRSAIDGKDGLAVMDERSFVDRMFPWFEPRMAPIDAADMAKLLSDPAVAERLAETRIRYVVWLDGATRDGEEGGGMACTIGPTGGGCLGLLWWEKNAAYEAAIWDLTDREAMGKITIDASGTSYVPALIIPLPLIARTQTTACNELGGQVSEFLGAR